MKSHFRISKEWMTFCGFFLFLFMIFTALQVTFHDNFAGWSNHKKFLHLLQYRPVSGQSNGLRFSACPEWDLSCHTAIDGTLMLKNNCFSHDSLELMNSISPNLPCRTIIQFVKYTEFNFRIHFAASQRDEYFLSVNALHPEESGIFIKSETGHKMLFDLSEITRNTRYFSSLEIAIVCRKDSFTVNLGSRSIELEAPEPVNRADLRISSLPCGLSFANSCATFVDRVAVYETGRDGTFNPVAESDFQRAPFFRNFSVSSGLNCESRTYLFISFLLLAVTALLFDFLLAFVLGTTSIASMSLYGFLFVLLPFQAAILSFLRTTLALPFSSLLYCFCLVACVKFFPPRF